MPYSTGTISSQLAPAREFMNAAGTALQAAGYQLVDGYGTTSAIWYTTAGNGQFVAVAANSATAITSPDGATWTRRDLPAYASWQGVAYGNGLFVAIAYASNLIATSPDGITWTARYLPTATAWSAVAYGAGLFVIVNNGTTSYLTSPDGITWTARTLPVTNTWTSLTYGAGTFVAVASGSSVTLTSPDGIAWTSRNNLPSALNWSSVAYGNNTFMAVQNTGNSAVVAVSTNGGVTWTSRPVPATGTYNTVAYGNNTFVTFAAATATAYSTTDAGTTWATRTLPATAAWYSAAHNGTTFAVLSQTAAAATSTDAATWTAQTCPPTSNNTWAEVWKSPAASNSLGQDWYLILRRAQDQSTGVSYQVAEQYNASTHRATNIGGTNAAATPTATTWTNPAGAVDPAAGASFATSAQLPLAQTAFSYWISATADRVVLATKTAATEGAAYCGLYEDLLPAGTTLFPLVCARFPTVQSNIGIGSGSTGNATGGFTREPGQTVSAATNFEAAIHNGYAGGNTTAQTQYTPMTTGGALYNNAYAPARVMLGSTRTAAALGDALRGLLYGVVCSTAFAVTGDSITVGGKTYARVYGIPGLSTYAYGYFVDQAL